MRYILCTYIRTMAEKQKIRYAVVGLGHIAQTAVLPAFRRARHNSELVALVSSDKKKLQQLGKKYSIPNCYSYADFSNCLESGMVDVVYICTPNTLHESFVKIAARKGVHILCEKPLASDERACLSMIEEARRNDVKLMTAYRLHFEAANLQAIEMAKANKLGDIRIFHSLFTMQVRDKNNIRLKMNMGGGPLFDIGLYCINAARYLFQDEPTEVMAMSNTGKDSRFKEVDEMTGAILRFPQGRLATFTVSFGAADNSTYDLVGTDASLRLENAYEYALPMRMKFYKDGKTYKKRFMKRDQFAAELLYFSDCILENREPEPSGWEGLADVKIVRALLRSARTGHVVHMDPIEKKDRPGIQQKITRASVLRAPKQIHATSPSEAV